MCGMIGFVNYKKDISNSKDILINMKNALSNSKNDKMEFYIRSLCGNFL